MATAEVAKWYPNLSRRQRQERRGDLLKSSLDHPGAGDGRPDQANQLTITLWRTYESAKHNAAVIWFRWLSFHLHESSLLRSC